MKLSTAVTSLLLTCLIGCGQPLPNCDTCDPGYTGPNCDVVIDYCASSPCLADASCVNGLNQYTCTCPSGCCQTFSYSACGDDFVTIYADGVELVGMREINTTVSTDIPVSTKVIGIRAENSFKQGGWKGAATLADGSIKYVSSSDGSWLCSTEEQFDNRWSTLNFDDSAWSAPINLFKYKTYARQCPSFPSQSQFVWVDYVDTDHNFLGTIYCRFRVPHIGVLSDGLPPCDDSHCVSCVLDKSKCDPVGCANGYVFNEDTFGCDACADHCAACIIAGAGRCDNGGCISGYWYDADSQSCKDITFTGCSDTGIWMYADGTFQVAKGTTSLSADITFTIPRRTVVLAVAQNITAGKTGGWRGFSSYGSIVTDASWKCSTSVPDDYSWKQVKFDDSAWEAADTTDSIAIRGPGCQVGYPSSAKFLFVKNTSASLVTLYCRKAISL